MIRPDDSPATRRSMPGRPSVSRFPGGSVEELPRFADPANRRFPLRFPPGPPGRRSAVLPPVISPPPSDGKD
jgi:hypothetical protein